MSLQKLLDGQKDQANITQAFDVVWSAKGVGFGQYYFYLGEDKKVHIDSECMSRESIKKILGILVDSAILDHEVKDDKQ